MAVEMFQLDRLRARAAAHSMRDKGYTQEQIADALSVDVRSVKRYLVLRKPILNELGVNQVWREEAACESMDTELFFPNANGLKARNLKREAMEICAGCPVMSECRAAAFQNYENYGVWGGMDFSRVRYSIDESTGRTSVRSVDGPLTEVG